MKSASLLIGNRPIRTTTRVDGRRNRHGSNKCLCFSRTTIHRTKSIPKKWASMRTGTSASGGPNGPGLEALPRAIDFGGAKKYNVVVRQTVHIKIAPTCHGCSMRSPIFSRRETAADTVRTRKMRILMYCLALVRCEYQQHSYVYT